MRLVAPLGLDEDSPAGDDDWFILVGGEQVGPFSVDGLRRRLASGEIGPRTYIWRGGMGDWVRLSNLPPLWESVRTALPDQGAESKPAGEPSVPTPPSKDGGSDPEEPSAPSTGPVTKEGPSPGYRLWWVASIVGATLGLVWGAGLLGDPTPGASQGLGLESPEAGLLQDDHPRGSPPPGLGPRAVGGPQALDLPDGLSPEAIAKVVNIHQGAMSLCVSEALKAEEQPRGQLDLEITIEPTGAVASVRVVSEAFRDTALGRCARRTVARWVFPRFEGEPVRVVFPYVLSAGM